MIDSDRVGLSASGSRLTVSQSTFHDYNGLAHSA